MKPIWTNVWVIAFSLLAFPIFSQTQISGIINQYAKVIDFVPCEAKLTVTSAAPYQAGDKVLLIQMQGAAINATNSNSFGNIEDMGAAGFYEINEVLSVTGNSIYLKYEPLHAYNAAHSLQLVTVPTYNNVEIVDDLKAKPWDGETGGVLILEATNLQLQADIEVNGLGFRGAQKLEVVSNCNFLTNADAYHYPTGNWRGSPKGEGIAALIPTKELGRGAQANGGGGGNDHNSGGGGGGNITAGGVGGKQSVSGFGCDGDYPGQGGKACPSLPERIYMGGGGGAGHFDDTGAGSSGGNGGGIAIILAQAIEANGFSIQANGAKPPVAQGDGAGGGGAGGTILLQTNSIIGSLNIEAKGGGGGNVNNTPDRCNGVGGGGSGGRLLTNTNNLAQISLAGGQPGINTVASSECSGPSNGGEAGAMGQQANMVDIAFAQIELIPAEIIEQPTDVVSCEGLEVNLTLQALGNNLEYQWQVNNGTGWQNITNSAEYEGALSPELTILEAMSNMDGHQYRCVISSPCLPDFFSETVTLELTNLPESAFSAIPLGNGIFDFLNNSLYATSFLWDFGDGTTSDELNPNHVYAAQGTFQVVLTSFNSCGQDTLIVSVSTESAPSALFSADLVSGCTPLTVHFQNQSSGSNLTGYSWEFPGGVPSFSTEQNPIVTYDLPGLYTVSLSVASPLGTDTNVQADFVEVHLVPTANFSFTVTENTVQFTNSSTGGSFYLWDFGDGNTSQAMNPVHEYTDLGVFDVMLTVGNMNCGSAISYQVSIEVLDTNEGEFSSEVQIFPNPVSNAFTVKWTKENPRTSRIRLLDSMGRIYQALDFQANSALIDMAGYSTGIYILEILNGEKTYFGKVVKL